MRVLLVEGVLVRTAHSGAPSRDCFLRSKPDTGDDLSGLAPIKGYRLQTVRSKGSGVVDRIVAGVTRQGFDLQLARHGVEDWRATFYPVGRAQLKRGVTIPP
jgi:hypothetical protein